MHLVTEQIADFEARQARLRGLRDRERDLATWAFDAGYTDAGLHHMQHWNFYDQQLDQVVQAGVA